MHKDREFSSPPSGSEKPRTAGLWSRDDETGTEIRRVGGELTPEEQAKVLERNTQKLAERRAAQEDGEGSFKRFLVGIAILALLVCVAFLGLIFSC